MKLRTLKPTPQRILGAVLVIMSVISVSVVAVQTERLSEVTECQAEYNSAYTKGLEQRSNAARRERQAQRDFLTSFLTKRLTEAQGRAVFERYLNSLDSADREREAARVPKRRC